MLRGEYAREVTETTASSRGLLPGSPRESHVRFGRYTVLRQIGSGGMGLVYAAHDPSLDRTIALKVLLHGPRRGPAWAQILVREARALARLAHPNVIQVHDVGQADGDVYIAMELVEGTPLDLWLEESPRPWREVVRVFLQAGQGLAAAHAAGLVHRDFKPDNCLLGRDGRVRVVDFGLARSAGDTENEAACTENEFSALLAAEQPMIVDSPMAGTPSYMSPEQFAGEATSEFSDQYAFAVSLWLGLFGSHPFPHSSMPDLVLAVRLGVPPIPPDGHAVPEWLVETLRVGMRVDPEARHPSMRALLANLEAGLSESALRAPRLGWRYEWISTRARDRLTGHSLHVEALTVDQSPERLERLLSLRHPNLGRVVDVVLGDTTHLLIDLPQGTESIESLANQPPSLVYPCLTQLLRALTYLRRFGLVHNDLRPANVRVHNGHVTLVGLESWVLGRTNSDLNAFARLARGLLAKSGFDSEVKSVAELVRVFPELGPLESAETREAILQTAPLCGREREWQLLSEALVGAFAGRPSLTVLSGESGAGKSRLLFEIGNVARARGAIVSHGGAKIGQASPFELWSRALESLALATPLLDEEATAFRAAVSDLDQLLGRAIGLPPEVAASTSQADLARALLAVVSRTKEPVVLLLEDVQWARPESTALLEAVADAPLGVRLAVFASARDGDGDAPRVGTELRLGRLDEVGVRGLLNGLLGERTETAALLQFIQRETEGNAFFLVEALRALAERAGGLERIAELESPSRVLGVGAERLIARRISSVAKDDLEPLELSAVVGRDIDRTLLAKLRPDLDVSAWLERLEQTSVLERLENRHRFSHDKLRETVEDGLGPERARELHEEVARELELLHGDRVAGALSLHFARAGDASNEARCAALAGVQALRTSSTAARVYLERAIELTSDTLTRARLHRHAGQACYELADFDGTERHFSQAMALLGSAPPRSRHAWLLFALREAGIQLWHRTFGTHANDDEIAKETSRAAGRLAKLWAHRPVPLRLIALALLAVNLGERSGSRNLYALGMLGYAAGLLGLKRLPAVYFSEVRESKEVSGERVEALVMEAMYLASSGQRASALSVADEGLELARKSGDRFGCAAIQAARAHALWFFGHLGELASCFHRALGEFDTSDHGHRATFQVGHGLGLYLEGHVDRADVVTREALELIPHMDHSIRASGLAVRCLVQLEQDRKVAAVQTARDIRSLLPRGDLVAPIFFHVPMACFEAHLAAGNQEELDDILNYERAWVRNSPLGEAQLRLHTGKLLRLRGQERAATREFERGIASARKRGTPVYEGLCLAELGKREAAESVFTATSAGLFLRKLQSKYR